GGEIQLDYVQPELGEGERFNIEGLWGVTGDNYNITVAASAFKQNSITQSDIDYGACNKRPRLTDQDGDGTIDNRDPVTGEELCFGFIYGFAVSPFGWVRYEPSLANPDPSNPNYDPRVNGVFGVPYYTSVPENGLDNSGAFYRDVRAPGIAHVRTEEDIFNLSSLGSYDFNIGERGATAYYEAYFNRRETASNRGYAQFFPTVPSTNPTNPFGTSNAAIMAAAGRGFNATPVLPNYGIIDPVTKVEIDRFNVFAGLKGDISETWTYEAYVGYGYSEGSYRRQAFLSKEVAASLDAVYNDQGQLVCRDLANNPGCVAANLFTEDAMLNGILPADYINYVTAYTEGETTYDSVQFSGFATGELFDLPAGAVEAVIGAETRRESIDDLPDEQDRAGNIFNATAAGRTEGTDTVKEIFGELFVPVLEDSPYADELNLELSGRWTDYDSYGD
ncbi:MAG: hypothetical protein OIF35_12720, partial [Cellvibrionaceae bacterium]|nr:hypothetical protein [Cellvibrionaceae bacterium]